MATIEEYMESAEFIKEKIGSFRPEIALVLGSGLGYVGDEVEEPVIVPYHEIPRFPVSTAPGHKGQLVFGRLEGKNVAAMQGRFHYYLGCEKVILTNAAGCINRDWHAGELMLITDHIKFFLDSPLRGENIEEFGCRFPDSSHIYTRELQELARKTAGELEIDLREGVYFYFPGPQYETPAEIRAASVLGGDAAGMSTVPEAITASHCGMQVLGFTLLSNMAAGILDQPLSEKEVLDAAKAASGKFSLLLRACIRKM